MRKAWWPVLARGVLNPLACWEWPGGKSKGYGRLKDPDTGRTFYAHRWFYEAIHGVIPTGLVIDHLCRNRACVNPRHMEPVTHRVNILRGVGTGAQHARQTHCKYGHELTPDNVYVLNGKWRRCRTCELRDGKQKYQRHRIRVLARQKALRGSRRTA